MHNAVASGLIVAMFLSSSPEIQAQLKVLDGDEVSLGRIYQTGEKVGKTIYVLNTGDERITITGVRTSCGCTAAVASDSVVDPGKQTQITVKFNPFGYMGEITKYIYISTSNPNQQLLTVKLTGYVAYALQPTPTTVTFPQMNTGSIDSSSVTLSNTSNEIINITKVEIPDSEITFRLEKAELRPGDYTDLHLYLRINTARNISGFVRILSTSKLQPVLQVRVFAGGYILK